jgi:hypothetical protein
VRFLAVPLVADRSDEADLLLQKNEIYVYVIVLQMAEAAIPSRVSCRLHQR